MFTNPYSELEKSSPQPQPLSFRICFNIILQNDLLFIERFEELVYETVNNRFLLWLTLRMNIQSVSILNLGYNTGI